MVTIEAKRLNLTELSAKDGSFIFELYNDKDFINHIGDRGIRTIMDAERFIESGPRSSYTDNGHGLYLVQLKDDTSIGICGLLKRDNLEHPDIGFATLPKYRREGYTFEAAKTILEDGRKRLELKRILAITASENSASIHLLKKLGIKFERKINMDNERHPTMLFSIHL